MTYKWFWGCHVKLTNGCTDYTANGQIDTDTPDQQRKPSGIQIHFDQNKITREVLQVNNTLIITLKNKGMPINSSNSSDLPNQRQKTQLTPPVSIEQQQETKLLVVAEPDRVLEPLEKTRLAPPIGIEQQQDTKLLVVAESDRVLEPLKKISLVSKTTVPVQPHPANKRKNFFDYKKHVQKKFKAEV